LLIIPQRLEAESTYALQQGYTAHA